MRGTREEVAENRRRIVAAASELFRIHGIDGVSVADIMREAGLTHGGFYGHFASKAALAAESCAHGFQASARYWATFRDHDPDPARAIFASYLSRAHVDNPGHGCVMPALGADTNRSEDPALGEAFTQGVATLAAELTPLLPEEEDVLAVLATLTGAVVLARAVGDRALGDRILAAALRKLRGEDAPEAS